MTDRMGRAIVLVSIALASGPSGIVAEGQLNLSPLPTGALSFGAFTARFVPDRSTPLRAAGTFTLEGEGWPTFNGSWKAGDGQIELIVPKGLDACDGPGRYRFRSDGAGLTFDLVSDGCEPRRMILDRSVWRPAGEARATPPRRIERTVADRTPLRATAGDGAGSWPSFRGPHASGRGANDERASR